MSSSINKSSVTMSVRRNPNRAVKNKPIHRLGMIAAPPTKKINYETKKAAPPAAKATTAKVTRKTPVKVKAPTKAKPGSQAITLIKAKTPTTEKASTNISPTKTQGILKSAREIAAFNGIVPFEIQKRSGVACTLTSDVRSAGSGSKLTKAIGGRASPAKSPAKSRAGSPPKSKGSPKKSPEALLQC